jgi:hypothetical protein
MDSDNNVSSATSSMTTTSTPHTTHTSLSNKRAQNYLRQIKLDKQDKNQYREFARNLGALLLTRSLILAPFERMQIIMQVKHIA